MPRIAYVNGRYVRHSHAVVHVEDRGYQFADGVYEVCEVARGFIIDQTPHLDRLGRSLGELRIDWPVERRALEMIMREVARRNGIVNGMIYIQVTRGVAPRDHVFPHPMTRPALVVTAKKTSPEAAAALVERGISVISVPENRWERVDIKTTGLLPNVLARQKAREAGAREAWFIDAEGMVTEGAATNAWMVLWDGTLVTRPAEFGILRGITRARVMEIAEKLGLEVDERPFSVEEALAAREVFITAATTLVMPVVEIDDRPVANGQPGSIAIALRREFFDIAEKVPAC